jgi:light-regulated signal transduction histidine kinase (bacteriophytochrome)
MRQLFQNLLSNALKYTQPNTPPHITIRSQIIQKNEFDHVQIDIEDQGIGFDTQYSDRIFGVFERLHARNQYEGTGIGLAICKKIVERHYGSIHAIGSKNDGATFTIMLPIRQFTTIGVSYDSA